MDPSLLWTNCLGPKVSILTRSDCSATISANNGWPMPSCAYFRLNVSIINWHPVSQLLLFPFHFRVRFRLCRVRVFRFVLVLVSVIADHSQIRLCLHRLRSRRLRSDWSARFRSDARMRRHRLRQFRTSAAQSTGRLPRRQFRRSACNSDRSGHRLIGVEIG